MINNLVISGGGISGLGLLGIIKYLDKTYPNRTSQPSDTLADIMYRSGQRSVIDFLKQKLNDQEV